MRTLIFYSCQSRCVLKIGALRLLPSFYIMRRTLIPRLRRYIYRPKTRADPADDVAEMELSKQNNAALWKRAHELEHQVGS